MYQRQGKSALKKDLKNTISLCDHLNNPEKRFKSIHIAGTNGKGSTAHMLAAIFQKAGYKTGLYTSPHLKDFRERVRINGEMISEDEIIDFVQRYKPPFEEIQPSFFEWTVALAFNFFAKEEVDIAIIETGLGGRLDSTNVLTPELSIITNISFDHMDLLGETLKEIAFEKAGIIKKEVPVVIGNHSQQKTVFLEKAIQMNSLIYFADSLKTNISLQTDLLGIYQTQNLKTVFQTWLVLRKKGWKISFSHLEMGLQEVAKSTDLRGRWEILSKEPLTIAETAHNEDGIKQALKQLQEYEPSKIHFVLGFVKDKDIQKILSLFPKQANYYFCQAKVPRAESALIAYNCAKELGLKGMHFDDVEKAIEKAKSEAKATDVIYIGGSNFIVAEAL